MSNAWIKRSCSHLSLHLCCLKWCQEISLHIIPASPGFMLECVHRMSQTVAGSSVLTFVTTFQCLLHPCFSPIWEDVLPSTAQLLGKWQHPRRWLSGAASPVLVREGNMGCTYVPASWGKHLFSLEHRTGRSQRSVSKVIKSLVEERTCQENISPSFSPQTHPGFLISSYNLSSLPTAPL